jgi:Cft2 family RNA processing exonuclease
MLGSKPRKTIFGTLRKVGLPTGPVDVVLGDRTYAVELRDASGLLDINQSERAMLARFPSQGVHDATRAEAIAQVNDVIGVAQKRLVDLKERRRKLNTELEFYQNDPKKAPANLRRQLDDNTESQAEQQRFIKQQEEEKQRINQRFDAELQQLRKLWTELPPAAPRSR